MRALKFLHKIFKTPQKACNFIKERVQHRCFPVKFTKFTNTYFEEQLWTTASIEQLAFFLFCYCGYLKQRRIYNLVKHLGPIRFWEESLHEISNKKRVYIESNLQNTAYNLQLIYRSNFWRFFLELPKMSNSELKYHWHCNAVKKHQI